MVEFVKVPSDVYTELVNYYQNAGIDASFVEKDDPETIDAHRALKVEGHNIDLIVPVMVRGVVGSSSGFGPSIVKQTTITHPVLDFHHIVKGVPTLDPSEVGANLVARTKGLLTKQILGLSWEGGRLASRLNADSHLLQQLLANGVDNLRIEADPKNRCVRMIYRAKIGMQTLTAGSFRVETTYKVSELPSPVIFGLLDGIAGRFKGTPVTAPPVTGPAPAAVAAH